MVRQYEIAKLDEAKEGPVLQQVDVALPPDCKSKPSRALIVIASALLALLLSSAWVVLRRYAALCARDPAAATGLARHASRLELQALTSRSEPSATGFSASSVPRPRAACHSSTSPRMQVTRRAADPDRRAVAGDVDAAGAAERACPAQRRSARARGRSPISHSREAGVEAAGDRVLVQRRRGRRSRAPRTRIRCPSAAAPTTPTEREALHQRRIGLEREHRRAPNRAAA